MTRAANEDIGFGIGRESNKKKERTRCVHSMGRLLPCFPAPLLKPLFEKESFLSNLFFLKKFHANALGNKRLARLIKNPRKASKQKRHGLVPLAIKNSVRNLKEAHGDATMKSYLYSAER